LVGRGAGATAAGGQDPATRVALAVGRGGGGRRLSAALEAIGGDEPAQRIAGIALLRRNVVERLDRAGSSGATYTDRRDAYGLFGTSMLIVQNYLRSAEVSSARPGTPAGAGYGVPKLASETTYAARELLQLLKLKAQVVRLPGDKLGVDLSHVVLYGQPWSGIDFTWVNHFSRGLDLRSANLKGLRWGTSYLGYSYLQCADLSKAVFGLDRPDGLHNASLVFADLRGANPAGARLQADREPQRRRPEQSRASRPGDRPGPRPTLQAEARDDSNGRPEPGRQDALPRQPGVLDPPKDSAPAPSTR